MPGFNLTSGRLSSLGTILNFCDNFTFPFGLIIVRVIFINSNCGLSACSAIKTAPHSPVLTCCERILA